MTLSPIFVDLVAALLSGRAALEIVARFDTHAGIEAQLAAASPDLILYGLQGGEAENVAIALLQRLPLAKVVVFSSDGHDAYVHTLRPHRKVLLDLSPRVLIRAILAHPRAPAT